MIRSQWRWLLLTLVITLTTWCLWVDSVSAESFDRQNLRMADLSNQDLRGNNYTRADLADANLSHANLQGVRMFDTTLAASCGLILLMPFWLGPMPLIRIFGKLRSMEPILLTFYWPPRLMRCSVRLPGVQTPPRVVILEIPFIVPRLLSSAAGQI
jgi:hypothetical protein